MTRLEQLAFMVAVGIFLFWAVFSGLPDKLAGGFRRTRTVSKVFRIFAKTRVTGIFGRSMPMHARYICTGKMR